MMSPPMSSCATQVELGQKLAEAIVTVYAAEKAYEGAKVAGHDLTDSVTALAHARQNESSATSAYHRHIDEHRCVVRAVATHAPPKRHVAQNWAPRVRR